MKTEDYPSGKALVELQALLKKRDKKARASQAWNLLVGASANIDFPVVRDFAEENGLIVSLSADLQNKDGQRAGSAWTNPTDGSEMIWIPPGPFCIGSKKQRAECVGFSLARFPVTNLQFANFIGSTKYQPPADHPEPEMFLKHFKKGSIPKGQEQHPVVYVSYIDALHYCRWAGMHLPTEWQWEKAARGPEGRPFPWGTEAPQSYNKLAHVNAKATCGVGQFPRVRSPYGCEDMIGNVSEWCHIGAGTDYANAPPPLPREGPIDAEFDELTAVRGSCFMRRQVKLMQSRHRRRLSQGRRNYWTGFRPAFCHSWRPAEVEH